MGRRKHHWATKAGRAASDDVRLEPAEQGLIPAHRAPGGEASMTAARQATGALLNKDKQKLAGDGQGETTDSQSKRPWPFGSAECRQRVYAAPTNFDDLLDIGGLHDPMMLAMSRGLTSGETEGRFDVYEAVEAARREAAALRARFGACDAGPPARPKAAASAPAPPTAAASGTGPGNGARVGGADRKTSWLEAACNKRGPSVPVEQLLNVGMDAYDPRFASAWRVLTAAERDLVKGFVLDGTRIGPGDLPAARAALLAVLDGNAWVGTEFKKAQTKRRDEALRACDESWAVIMAGDGSAEDKEAAQRAGGDAMAGEAQPPFVFSSGRRSARGLAVRRAAPQVPSSKEGTGGAGASGSSLRSSDLGGLSDGLSGPGALLLRSGNVADPMPWETPLCMGPGDGRGGACAPEVHAGDEAPGAVTDGADAEAPASPPVSAICERVDNLSGLFSLEHVVLLHSHGAPAALAVPGNEVSLPGAALAGQLRLLVADAFADEVWAAVLQRIRSGAPDFSSCEGVEDDAGADLNPDPSPGVLLVVAASAEGNAAAAAAEELPALEVGADLSPMPDPGALPFEAALVEGAAVAAAPEELPAFEGEGAAEEPAPAAAVGNPNPAAPAPLPDPEPVQAVPVEGEAAAVALAPVAGEAAGEALAPVAGEAAGEALAPVADEAAGEVPIPAPAVVAEIPAEQPRRIVRCGRALVALAVLAAVGQHYAPAPVKPVARAVYTGFLVTGIAGTEGKLLGQAALGAAAAAVGGTRHAGW
ncbi:hypothetical protein WJX81_003989 [Elliptochloris bilobata]|uniref:Uncharacterized protein n=1 Tax=Elliptochloris bilobata TaxID=381761 RepID=A0AAW1RKH0_9CHLO